MNFNHWHLWYFAELYGSSHVTPAELQNESGSSFFQYRSLWRLDFLSICYMAQKTVLAERNGAFTVWYCYHAVWLSSFHNGEPWINGLKTMTLGIMSLRITGTEFCYMFTWFCCELMLTCLELLPDSLGHFHG